MRFILFISAILSLLIVVGPSLGKDRMLSWLDCVKATSNFSSSLQLARQNLDLQKEQSQQSKSFFLPEIYGQLDVQQFQVYDPTTDFKRDYGASLIASQNLFAGQRDKAQHRWNQEALRAAEWALASSKAAVSNQLISAYQGLLYAKTLQTLAKDIVERRSNNVRLVELRFNGGMENQGSLLLARAYLKEAQFAGLQADQQWQLAKAQLTELMGLPLKTEFDVSENIPLPLKLEKPIDVKTTTEQHPDYLQIQAEAEGLRWGITVAKAKYFPSLDLTAKYGHDDKDFFPDDSRQLSYGLSIRIPIYNGGRDSSNLRLAEIKQISASQKLEDMRRRLATALEKTSGEFRQAVEKLELDKDFEDAAKVRSEIARRKYDNGLLSFENWDIIENDLIIRQNSLAKSRNLVVLASAAWIQAQGKGVIP